MKGEPVRDVSPRAAAWLLGLILLAGLAFRVWAAGQNRVIVDPDGGVVALMAKDMAEGRAWPVFFYGQSYMGSLEPAFSALLGRLFGVTGFTVSLGSALLGWLLLPVMYAWGRDAAGRRAGLVAAAFCVACTFDSFFYMVTPRGGYALMVVLTAGLLWLTPRLAWRIREGGRPVGGLFGLGVLAGLDWWTHQLSIEVLCSCGLLTLLVAGRRLFQPALLAAGGLGFLLGSAPFWWWNATHDWETFRYLGGTADGAVIGTVKDFLTRFDRWAGVEKVARGWCAAVELGYAGLLGTALFALGRAAARRTWTLREAHLLSALLLLGSSFLFFTRTSLAAAATARYLVPLVPVFALLAGYAVAQAAGGPGRGWRITAALAGLALILSPAARLPGELRAMARNGEIFASRAHQVAERLRQADTKLVYCSFRYHAFNFLTGERPLFLVPEHDHLVDRLRDAEAEEHVAVLSNHGGAHELTRAAGGSAALSVAGGIRILHTFVAPTNALAELPPSTWTTTANADLCDGSLATRWQFVQNAAHAPELVITLTPPAEVAAVRLATDDHEEYPRSWQISGRVPGGTNEVELMPDLPATHFHWSGPRPYALGFAYRLEARFAPTLLGELRIRIPTNAGERACAIGEVALFGPGGPVPAEIEARSDLLATLRTSRVSRLYTDRWIGSQIRRELAGRLECPGQPFWLDDGWRDHLLPLRLEAGTALLPRCEDAPACRRVLERAGVKVTEQPIPPWTLLACDAPHAPTNLVWLGTTCAER